MRTHFLTFSPSAALRTTTASSATDTLTTDAQASERVGVQAVALYVALAYGWSWGLAGVYFGGGFAVEDALAFTVMGVAFMYGPAVGALVVKKLVRGRPLAEIGMRLAFNRWWLVAWLAPLALAGTAGAFSVFVPGAHFVISVEGVVEQVLATAPAGVATEGDTEEVRALGAWLPLILVGGALFNGATVAAVAAFGEEVGWRGFLQNELAPLGFWNASGVVGIVWGLWHAPLILAGYNYPEHPVLGVFMMTLMTVLLAPLFAYVAMRARTVLAAALMHGAFNTTAGLTLFFVAGGPRLATGMTGAAGLAALACANALLFFHRRRTVSQNEPENQKTINPENQQ